MNEDHALSISEEIDYDLIEFGKSSIVNGRLTYEIVSMKPLADSGESNQASPESDV